MCPLPVPGTQPRRPPSQKQASGSPVTRPAGRLVTVPLCVHTEGVLLNMLEQVPRGPVLCNGKSLESGDWVALVLLGGLDGGGLSFQIQLNSHVLFRNDVGKELTLRKGSTSVLACFSSVTCLRLHYGCNFQSEITLQRSW